MQEEIWKPIDGYEELYEVSNLGKIRSLDRTTVQCNNGTLTDTKYKGKELKGKANDKGYVRVHVSKDGKGEYLSVHRAVATAFCEKPEGCNIVNHLDNNPSNNEATNLEWTTYKGNMQWASKQGRMGCHPENLKKAQEARHKAVIATDKDGNEYMFNSQAEAAKVLNITSTRGHIGLCCKQRYGYKSTGGYTWRYANE